MSHKLILPRVKWLRSLFKNGLRSSLSLSPLAIATKGKKSGLNGKKNSRTSRYFLLSVAFFFLAEKKSFFDLTGRVPGVPKALYSLGARIHGPPLVDAFSRRHVCFSVVKRAAGLQTGLNQPPLLSLSLFFSSSTFLLSPSLCRFFLPGTSRLLPTSPFLLRASRANRIYTVRSVSQSDRVTNCFLFERTN